LLTSPDASDMLRTQPERDGRGERIRVAGLRRERIDVHARRARERPDDCHVRQRGDFLAKLFADGQGAEFRRDKADVDGDGHCPSFPRFLPVMSRTPAAR
jgi:hypothetical protein